MSEHFYAFKERTADPIGGCISCFWRRSGDVNRQALVEGLGGAGAGNWETVDELLIFVPSAKLAEAMKAGSAERELYLEREFLRRCVEHDGEGV